MAQQRPRHEFRVVVDGVELPSDVVERVNTAVQKAAMTELAGLDLAGDFRVRLPGGFKRPIWWGIWLERVTEDQLARGGIATPKEFGGPG